MAQKSLHIADIISNKELRQQFIQSVEAALPEVEQQLKEACVEKSFNKGALAQKYATLYALKLMNEGSPDGSTLISFLKDLQRPQEDVKTDVADFKSLHSNILQIAWAHTVALVGERIIMPFTPLLKPNPNHEPSFLFGSPVITASTMFDSEDKVNTSGAKISNYTFILGPIFQATEHHFARFSAQQDAYCAKLDKTLQSLADNAKKVIREKYAEMKGPERVEAKQFFLGLRALHYAYSIGGTVGMIAALQAGEERYSRFGNGAKEKLASLSSKGIFTEAARCASWEWSELSRRLPVEEIDHSRRGFLQQAGMSMAGFAVGTNLGRLLLKDIKELDPAQKTLLIFGTGAAVAAAPHAIAAPIKHFAEKSHTTSSVLWGIGSIVNEYSQMKSRSL